MAGLIFCRALPLMINKMESQRTTLLFCCASHSVPSRNWGACAVYLVMYSTLCQPRGQSFPALDFESPHHLPSHCGFIECQRCGWRLFVAFDALILSAESCLSMIYPIA